MEPMGLPRGSIRAVIVLSLVAATVVLSIWGDEATRTALVGILGFAVRDYFSHRSEQDAQNGPPLPPPA